jgi:interferon gamma-inducible protein 30
MTASFAPAMIFPGRIASFLVANILLQGLFLQHRWWSQRQGILRGTVKLQVYVEALCIDSKAFFDQQLMPVYETLGPDVIDLEVVVFGNARVAPSLTCQHGLAECDANSYEQCAAYVSNNDASLYLPFMGCLFDALRMGHRDVVFPANKYKACARAAPDGWWDKVQQCHDDPALSAKLQQAAADATPTNHKYVPWVVVNGLQSTMAESDLLTIVCRAYQEAGGFHPACSSSARS